jgi:CRP-like cAMP-binding protein
VTPAGVQLSVPLTHELLARIVGARRPTVTSALRNLRADGLVTRGPGGSWLLHGEPPGRLHDLRAQVAG